MTFTLGNIVGDEWIYMLMWAVPIIIVVVYEISRWLRLREVRRHDEGHCPMCDYDLRSDFDHGCPECGWNRKPTDERPEAEKLVHGSRFVDVRERLQISGRQISHVKRRDNSPIPLLDRLALFVTAIGRRAQPEKETIVG